MAKRATGYISYATAQGRWAIVTVPMLSLVASTLLFGLQECGTDATAHLVPLLPDPHHRHRPLGLALPLFARLPLAPVRPHLVRLGAHCAVCAGPARLGQGQHQAPLCRILLVPLAERCQALGLGRRIRYVVFIPIVLLVLLNSPFQQAEAMPRQARAKKGGRKLGR